MTTSDAQPDSPRTSDAAPRATWNPWTIIRTSNPLFYLAYAASSILMGGVALTLGLVGFIALPWVAHQVSRWERGRVTVLGLPAVPSGGDGPSKPWLWARDVDVKDLGGWMLSVVFGFLTTIAAVICAALGGLAYASLINDDSFRGTVGGVLLLVIAIAVTLMAAAGVSGLQAASVRRLLSPSPDLGAQVAELTTSRARIVGGFEVERRRIERDLHDGAQQYLVASSMKVGEAAYLLESSPDPAVARAAALLAEAQNDSDQALRSLRETVAGIHPKILSDRGLEAAVRDVAVRQRIGVDVAVPAPLPPLSDDVSAAAYYLVAEALTNVAKHAPNASAHVVVSAGDRLRVTVTDTGPGGAVVRVGGGLAGLVERFAALDGRVTVSSPPHGPTQVHGELPILGGRTAWGRVPTDDTKPAHVQEDS